MIIVTGVVGKHNRHDCGEMADDDDSNCRELATLITFRRERNAIESVHTIILYTGNTLTRLIWY